MINLNINKHQPLNTAQLRTSTGFVHSKDSQLSQSNSFELIDNPSNRVFISKNLLAFKGNTETVFDSAIANIKATSGDKEAREVLVNILTKMNMTINFADANNSPSSDIKSFGYSMSQKDKAFADKLSDKYCRKGHYFYPTMFVPEKLENIISEANYHLIDMTDTQYEQLKKIYDNFASKEYLKVHTIQLLNHNKDLPEFLPFKKEIETIVNDFENRINLLGLSQKTKLIVEGINRDLGVKVDMPDLPHVAKILDEQLRLYKHPEINFALPERFTFNSFMSFAVEDKNETAAMFTHACDKTINDEDQLMYSKLCGQFNTSKIAFNPFLLYELLDDNKKLKPGKTKEFSDLLRHELGHFWHLNNIGIDKFIEKKGYALIFTDDEKKLITQFIEIAEKLEQDWPATNVLRLETLSEYYQLIHEIKDKKKHFNKQFLIDLKPVIEKVNRIVEAHLIVDQEFPEGYRQHAKSTILEMVAFAIQFKPYKQFDKKSETFFAKHGMPEMKDRCLLADKEKYINPQPEAEPIPTQPVKQTGGFLNKLKKFFH